MTFTNGAWFQARKRGLPTDHIPRYLYAFAEDNKYLYLPRFTDWNKFGLDQVIIRNTFPVITPVKITGKIRADQRTAYRALEQHIEHAQSGILSLAPGKGKTVLSVLAWASLEPATPGLAIVTTLRIGKQWKDRLLENTDIKEHHIGKIGDGEDDWQGKKFVIATLQSLASKEFPDEFYKYFGICYMDECHRLGAPSFNRVAGLFSGIRIGLSATWARADGLEKLFMLHLGPVFYEDREQVLTPTIYFVRTPVDMNLDKFRMWNRAARKRQGDINHARVVTYLSRDEKRQDFILRFVRQAYDAHRKVLVLGDRKEELAVLAHKVGEDISGICVGSLEGKVLSEEKQQAALQMPIVFATSQLVKEGLDQPDIDTLVILYPQSNEAFGEQAVGRILRRDKGKQHPIVVVMCDSGLWIEEEQQANFDWHSMSKKGGKKISVYPFKRTCERMQTTFKKLGYIIERPVR